MTLIAQIVAEHLIAWGLGGFVAGYVVATFPKSNPRRRAGKPPRRREGSEL